MNKRTVQKTIKIQYYAVLKEQRGKSEETFTTSAPTVSALYSELQQKYQLKLPERILKVAINDEFKNWQTKLKSGDSVVFIPPVAGG